MDRNKRAIARENRAVARADQALALTTSDTKPPPCNALPVATTLNPRTNAEDNNRPNSHDCEAFALNWALKQQSDTMLADPEFKLLTDSKAIHALTTDRITRWNTETVRLPEVNTAIRQFRIQSLRNSIPNETPTSDTHQHSKPDHEPCNNDYLF